MTILLLLALAEARAPKTPPPPPPDVDADALLLGRALLSDEAWTELAWLTDHVGARLAGSPALDRAIAWAAASLAEDGLPARLEPVLVPVWVRGEERARVVSPAPQELEVLGLGGSVATPPGGLEAEVLVVDSFDALAARANDVPGRIVVFDAPFTTYGETVEYRAYGPSRAAALGAVAALVRSVAPAGHQTAHTGAVHYEDGAPSVPAGALTHEGAATLRRLTSEGPVRLHLTLDARTAPDALSHNVTAEVRGRELPDEVVLLGCHLDSWDVGTGAQDDGAGCVAVMEAAALVASLPVAPRRTVRVVLFTNEENGLRGATAYAEAHAAERHVAAIEADTGAGVPTGFRVDWRDPGQDALVARLNAGLGARLGAVGAGAFRVGFAGSDISPLCKAGVPCFGLDQDMSGYWPIHHTEADTLDKIDPSAVDRMVAALALLAWSLAEAPSPLLE